MAPEQFPTKCHSRLGFDEAVWGKKPAPPAVTRDIAAYSYNGLVAMQYSGFVGCYT
jgi:hypothetical protein